MNKITLNWKKQREYFITLDNDTILNFIAPYVQKFKKKYNNLFLILKQNNLGCKTVTLPDNIKWCGGKIPILSKLPNAIDLITLYYCNKYYYAIFSPDM